MQVLVLFACALLLTGCGRGRRDPVRPETEAPSSALAAPVVAPMAARDRLLRDLGQQKVQAREREATFDEATGRDR